jgi:hypothetical protein
VREDELARGSIETPWQPLKGTDVHAFRGRDFGRDLMFNYLCVDGRLQHGNFYFPIESLDAAIATYLSVRDNLVLLHGSPFYDIAQKISPSDPVRYMTSWNMHQVSVLMSLMPNFQTEESGWRVWVVYRQTN